MSAVGDLVTELLDALTGAGVTATADPDLVSALVASAGYVALVEPPAVTRRTLDGHMRAETVVRLLVSPPGGARQWATAWEQLPAAMDVLGCTAAPRESREIGSISYPGYRLTVTQRTTPLEEA